MAEQPNDFVRAIQELITNSATDQIRASRQFNELPCRRRRQET